MHQTLQVFRSTLFQCFAMAALAGAVLHGCSSGEENGPLAQAAARPVTQIDRMAIPVINTVFITPAANKDAFNQGDPSTDVARFHTIALDHLNAIRAAVNAVPGFPPEDAPGISSAALIDFVIPDAITVDLSQPVQFPNGRKLTDDVIDAELGLTLNRGNPLGGGPGVSDGVANDSEFLATFPYLGRPN